MVYVKGDLGSGKTEAIIRAAIQVARGGGKVLILCTNGQLVTPCRQRLGEDDSDAVVVETLHSGSRGSARSGFAHVGTARQPSPL